MAIFELSPVDDAFKARIVAGSSATELRRHAREAGMRTLREDGWRRVGAGQTTVEEVLRVTKMEG